MTIKEIDGGNIEWVYLRERSCGHELGKSDRGSYDGFHHVSLNKVSDQTTSSQK